MNRRLCPCETNMTLLVHDHIFLNHETGRHPECPDRLKAIEEELVRQGLFERTRKILFTTIDESEILRLHTARLLKAAKDLAKDGGGMLDADTVCSPRSYDVALHAAGGCVAAVDAVLNKKAKTALSLIRPPGHHATPDKAMGFCLFNNVALAADHARTKHGLQRILIIDWDVHHGNGTQDIFYSDGQVTFLSLHRYGAGFYPGTGSADETGTGAGLGHTINVPLKATTTATEFRDAFRKSVEAAATMCKPELIILSAGFDAHKLDPVGGLNLDVEDFVWMTETVLQLAKTHCGGRLVSCLEGGYHLQATAQSVAAHLDTLIKSE
jgi:acetoin utilization deacetylase AcuC-like enzyme